MEHGTENKTTTKMLEMCKIDVMQMTEKEKEKEKMKTKTNHTAITKLFTEIRF